MSYLIKQQVTANSVDDDSSTHFAGDVVSDWELSDHIRAQIKKGVPYYIQRFEPLSDREAYSYRKKATTVEGKRNYEGVAIDPPWDDFVGLHPKEVIERMRGLSFHDVEKVRQYEKAGLARDTIIEYVAPSEREPWEGYDEWSPRDILEKMELLDNGTVQEVIVYEMNHKERPAIITFEPEETSPHGEDEEISDDSGKVPAGVGASTGTGE